MMVIFFPMEKGWFSILPYDLLVWFIKTHCDARTTFAFLSTCHRLRNSMYQNAVFRRWLAYGEKPAVKSMLKFGSCEECGLPAHIHAHSCPFSIIGCVKPGCRHRRVFLTSHCQVCNQEMFHCPLSNTVVRCAKHAFYTCFGCNELIDPALTPNHTCLKIEDRFSKALNMRIHRKGDTTVLSGATNWKIIYVYITDTLIVPSLKQFHPYKNFRVFIYDEKTENVTCWFEFKSINGICLCFTKNMIGLDGHRHCSQCMATGACECENRKALTNIHWI